MPQRDHVQPVNILTDCSQRASILSFKLAYTTVGSSQHVVSCSLELDLFFIFYFLESYLTLTPANLVGYYPALIITRDSSVDSILGGKECMR